MIRPKDRGGMGFRDIHLFNKALLAKHTWPILNRENFLLTKFLMLNTSLEGIFCMQDLVVIRLMFGGAS